MMKKLFSFKLFFASTILLWSHISEAQITSTFDTDAGGWKFYISNSIDVTYKAAQGNPGGFISKTYNNPNYNTEHFLAPAKFLGSQVALSLYQELKFDMQVSNAGTFFNHLGDVRIKSGNTELIYSLTAKPAVAPAWSTYTLKLNETQGWRIGAITGALATRAQIIQALINITSMEFRGNFTGNTGGQSHTAGLDNVA